MPTKLSVNVNKIATLRNTRALNLPSITRLAKIAIDAGAHGITVHPRPDQRHIRPQDVIDLAALLKSQPSIEFNIEGNPFIDYVPHVERTRPAQCTLVPDTPEAFTSNQGWAIRANFERLKLTIAQLKPICGRVSIFMDADSPDIELAREVGADRIELYTEPYAVAFAKGGDALKRSLDLYRGAAVRAHKVGLGVNAGHDLNTQNLPVFVQTVPNVDEVSIGHALIADALEFGMAETVRRYLAVLR